jgi:hypothetical protein
LAVDASTKSASPRVDSISSHTVDSPTGTMRGGRGVHSTSGTFSVTAALLAQPVCSRVMGERLFVGEWFY